MSNKNNIDYLRHILDTLGNLMGEDNYRESIEWLDAIQDEMIEKDGLVASHKDEVTVCEEQQTNLRSQLAEFTTGEGLANEIKTGMEPLFWDCNNIGIQGLMETFGKKLNKIGHIKLESALSSL
jgi:hypothetical protein